MRRSELTTSRRLSAALLLAGLLCASVTLFPAGGDAKPAAKKKKQQRPNIVMVMTDDEAAEQQRFLPKTNALLGDGGVTFKNSFANYSLCCPSRSTWLTGQYSHNHDVRGNQSPAGGYGKIRPFLGNSLPVWLQRAGYYTGHIGKFLNGYGSSSPDTEVPPGWSEWYGALDDPDAYPGGTYTMYGYTLNENGRVVHYGSTPDVVDPPTYQTDVYSAKARDFISRRAPSDKPFFLSVAPLASHAESGAFTTNDNNPRAAPRHEGALAAEQPPSNPSFNEADVSDKPQAIQGLALMNAAQQELTRDRYRARAESLLAVDEMVSNMAKALKAKGEWKNTVFIFTTDNGFFHGEHRVRQGKVRLYEESIRLPLLMRGPGIPKNKTRSQPVVNADLAPTIVDFAGARSRRKMDGRSLIPIAQDRLYNPGRPIDVEAYFNSDPAEDPETPPTNFQAVRTDRYLYAEYGTGEQELYDLYTDPFELQSQHANPAFATVKAALDRLLDRTRNCAGKSCMVKPALKLQLKFGAGRGGCVAGGVRAKASGADVPNSESARFYVNGRRAGADGSSPFDETIGAKLLRGTAKNRVIANVTLTDGRIVTVKRAAPAAC